MGRSHVRAFTLVEILVAVGVFVILGVALVGLMGAAMDAWHRGEASREANEKFQALRRQIAADLSAAILDPLPPADFHFVLDTPHDLLDSSGQPNELYTTLLGSGPFDHRIVRETTDGQDVAWFAPASRPGNAEVLLAIRVPFLVGSAVLKARCDVFDPDSTVRILVARNDPGAEDPAQRDSPPPDGDPRWKEMDRLEGEGIGGGETDITAAVQGGDIVFVKAILDNASPTSDGAQFLRGDLMRAGGRPVLILDCYRSPNAFPHGPRPTFAAFFANGSQVITFSRTLSPEQEQADAGADGFTGRAQVVYRIRPYHPTVGKPGLGVLRRAFVCPIPGEAGEVESGVLGRNIVRLIDDIPDQAFIPNVLYLGMAFWGPETTTWETRPDLEPGYETKYDEATRPRPPSTVWLSSRYLPEQVQVTACLEPVRGKTPRAALIRDLAADCPAAEEDAVDVTSIRGFDNITRPSPTFYRDPRHFVKVEDEWIFYERIAEPGRFILRRAGSDGLACRGARGTKVKAHPAGAEVYKGFTSVFTVRIPAFRHWQR